MQLRGKTAVVYGGGGAIGGAVARAFAREGAGVFLAGRTLARLTAVATEIADAGGTVQTSAVASLRSRSRFVRTWAAPPPKAPTGSTGTPCSIAMIPPILVD